METNFTKKFHWLLGKWKTVNGQWIFEEWWQKDERTLQGFRHHLRRGNDIYYIIIASDTAERVELRMNFSDGQMTIFENLTGTFPNSFDMNWIQGNICM